MLDNKFQKEAARCLGCKARPCQKACPLGVSPTDFIKAIKENDFKEAALEIASKNPLPQTCGLICPDKFCQKACIRARMDQAIAIPCLQAEIMRQAGCQPLVLPQSNGKKAAVVGGGPAGLGATYEFIMSGWSVDIYEANCELGGAVRLIPAYRLTHQVLDNEIKRIVGNERVKVFLGTKVEDFYALKEQYDSVVLALGEPEPRKLGICGEEHCVPFVQYLSNPTKFKGMKVCVTGGGEVALDCAITAKKCGAEVVEMFVRRRKSDMRVMVHDREELAMLGVKVRELSSVITIKPEGKKFDLEVVSNRINDEGKAEACRGTEYMLSGYDIVIQALGAYYPKDKIPQNFAIAGDMTGECGTVVQALASGKAAARRVILEKA